MARGISVAVLSASLLKGPALTESGCMGHIVFGILLLVAYAAVPHFA
jgi:hypothetical protein